MASPSPFDNVQFPSLSSLPFREGDPKGAIWGFYEHLSQSDKQDELGALNLLTPKRILHASQTEIKVGKVCSLNWELHKPILAHSTTEGYIGRKGLEHRIFRIQPEMLDKTTCVVDDEVGFNTQCGSQWDGFKHWAYYETGQFYNGLEIKDVIDEDGLGVTSASQAPVRNGIHTFQGKIVGRGVLLDYFSYAEQNNTLYNPADHYSLTAKNLDACAKSQGVTFQQGDILFIRTGFVNWCENSAVEERQSWATKSLRCVGVRQDMEEVEWLWNHHFAAVASDTPGFEASPNNLKWNLHDYLLPLWGTPIGEFFDLEELSKTCKELGRYSFFVTSSPLNVVNGVASPPNALAIF